MNTAKLLGTVYVWQKDGGWRYAESQERAPDTAEAAKLLDVFGEELLWIELGSEGQFIRGAERVS
jgi:hypothetical protein